MRFRWRLKDGFQLFVHIQRLGFMTHGTTVKELPPVISTPLGDLRLEGGSRYVFIANSDLEALFERLAGISGIEQVDILTPHWENKMSTEGAVEKALFMEPLSEKGKSIYRAYDAMPSGYITISDLCGKQGTMFVAPEGAFNPVPVDLSDILRDILTSTSFGFGSQIGPIRSVTFEWPVEDGKVLKDPEHDVGLVVLGRLRFSNGSWIALSGCPYGSNCGQDND